MTIFQEKQALLPLNYRNNFIHRLIHKGAGCLSVCLATSSLSFHAIHSYTFIACPTKGEGPGRQMWKTHGDLSPTAHKQVGKIKETGVSSFLVFHLLSFSSSYQFFFFTFHQT